uniref:Uncharacterized protein n=1 Tax=Bracon brevicornis TaxID=1563983 RepID=A0A6V7IJK5_9HYME
MTVQEFKPRGAGGGNGGVDVGQQQPVDILSPPESIDNDKEQHQQHQHFAPQDSENLLGRVLAGKLLNSIIFTFFVTISQYLSLPMNRDSPLSN